MKNFITIMLLAVVAFSGFSQSICSYQFVDNGGVSGNYSQNSNDFITFCPDNPNDNVTEHSRHLIQKHNMMPCLCIMVQIQIMRTKL